MITILFCYLKFDLLNYKISYFTANVTNNYAYNCAVRCKHLQLLPPQNFY